ncbi:MAG: hypothetical protein AAF762_00840 [Pseudomonadota bacterium]
MSDISELERRIAGALDRAAQAMDRMSVGGGDGEDTAALAAELEAERMANAQLEERVRAIKEKQEGRMAELERDVARLRDVVEARDETVQQIRAVNDELRKSNAALREANAKGLADADLVNGAMQTELDALRSARAADRAEVDDVLATLDAVLKEA